MKFLVTGGAGFIGSNIVKLLVEKKHEVIVLDNFFAGKKVNLESVLDKIDFYQIDLRNKQKVKEITKNIDGIFHQAALTSVPESFKNTQEFFDVNVNGTKHIFEIANQEKIRVVFASSSSVYGDVKNTPIKESQERIPINPYGQTKLEKEIVAEKLMKNNVSIIGLRYFNVYGIGQNGTYAGVITKFLENLKKNEPLIINGKGEQIRDFIHVKDIANLNLVAMESKISNGFFNVGTGISTSINQLANMMIEFSGLDNKIIHGSPLKGDIEKSLADINFTKNSFSWLAKTDLKTGLKKMVDYYLSK